MKKVKLIDVIHLYVGQRIISYIGNFSESDVIKGVVGGLVVFKINSDGEIQDSLDLHYKFKKGCEPKLMLRPVSELILTDFVCMNYDMTIFTDGYLRELFLRKQVGLMDSFKTEEFLYLLKEGFDIFGLIESGQAIKL